MTATISHCLYYRWYRYYRDQPISTG